MSDRSQPPPPPRALWDALGAAWLLEDAERRIRAVNTAWCRLFALGDPEALLGRPADALHRQIARRLADPAAALASADAALTRGEPRRGELLTLADGRVFERDYVPVHLDDGTPGHAWHLRDVTDHHRAVAALEAAVATAAEAEAARDAFLAGLSHELRTPLNAVLGLSELVGEVVDDPEVKGLLDGVRRNAVRLLRLMERLLLFADPPAPEENHDFDPVELIEEIAVEIAPVAGEHGALVVCRADPALPLRLAGSAASLRQLLGHLAAHAAHAATEGLIELSVEPAGAGPPGGLLFTVRDTIDRQGPLDVDALLESVFWRGIDGGGEPGVGRGVLRRLVERTGGRVDVHPAAPGTTFRVHWTGAIATPRPTERPLLGRRILIADPHPRRLTAHAWLCHALGATVAIATDDAGLAAVLARAPIDVALVADPLTPPADAIPWIGIAGVDGTCGAGCVTCLGRVPRRAELIAALRALDAEAEGAARVLICDDLPDNLLVMRRFIEAAGHRVATVETGEAAVAAVRADAFDLVLMDVHLPGIDGIEAARRIAGHETSARLTPTPVVAVTAHATDDVRRRARRAGMAAFVVKPAGREALAEVIRRHRRRGPVLLIVERDPVACRLLLRWARGLPAVRPRCAEDAAAAWAVVDGEGVDFALVGDALGDPDRGGLELARQLIRRGIRCAMMMAHDAHQSRQSALAIGCVDVLTRPLTADAVSRVIHRLEAG
ncbi:MAG: response regulator [bacterium]